MRRRSYEDETLREAVAQCTSLRQVMLQLGLVPAGGNYATLQHHIDRLGISTGHFRRPAHYRRRPVTPTAKLLSRGTIVQSYKLKTRLLREGLLEARCVTCRRTTWQDCPIPLELHHCDGDRHNNTLNNLALLCPNCHAMTASYRGRNIGKV